MPRNIEIKAVLPNRDAVLAVLAKKCEQAPETILQHDFFFRCTEGRLKLRVFDREHGELIRYERDNGNGPRGSQYEIARTSDPAVLLDILVSTLGRLGEVKKTRILYRVGQTRVHIDRVDGLGDFLELEVVLRPDQTDCDGQRIAESLLREFGIEKSQFVAQAYVDLLLRLPLSERPSESVG